MKNFNQISGLMCCVIGFAGFVSPVQAQTVTDRFEPTLSQSVLDADYESGFLPENSALQVNVATNVEDLLSIEMKGDADYNWEAQQILFTGDENGGSLNYSLDTTTDTSIRVQMDIPAVNETVEVASDLSQGIPLESVFTPYLLTGDIDENNAARAEEIQRAQYSKKVLKPLRCSRVRHILLNDFSIFRSVV